MTHNQRATSLIELSVYLLMLILLGYLTFTLVITLSTHARTIYTKTTQCCMVYTTLQLIRIDLMTAQHMHITPSESELELQTTIGRIVWHYNATRKQLVRIHEHVQNKQVVHNRSLILEHLDAWQLKPLKQHHNSLYACSLQLNYAARRYEASLFMPSSEEVV